MKVVIVEDEKFIAVNLSKILLSIDPAIVVVKVLGSVSEAVDYFEANSAACDLIFSDVNLGDGICFEIFERVRLTQPIVFCTAYDQYALEAFNFNGIDYVMKPFNEERIFKTMQKINSFFVPNRSVLKKPDSHKVFIVHKGGNMLPVKLENILAFVKEPSGTKIIDINHLSYSCNSTIQDLEGQLGEEYFRINRQVIIHRNAISNISKTLTRKLELTFPFRVDASAAVSKEKATQFLKWVDPSY